LKATITRASTAAELFF